MTSEFSSSKRIELLRNAQLDSWIALSADETRIVATAKTFIEAATVARESGERDYFLIRTPDAWLPLS